jgi:hypothetical protein
MTHSSSVEIARRATKYLQEIEMEKKNVSMTHAGSVEIARCATKVFGVEFHFSPYSNFTSDHISQSMKVRHKCTIASS